MIGVVINWIHLSRMYYRKKWKYFQPRDGGCVALKKIKTHFFLFTGHVNLFSLSVFFSGITTDSKHFSKQNWMQKCFVTLCASF